MAIASPYETFLKRISECETIVKRHFLGLPIRPSYLCTKNDKRYETSNLYNYACYLYSGASSDQQKYC